LPPEEFADLGLYLARPGGEGPPDIGDLALLEGAVRQELLRSGVSRVFAVDIHDFAQNPFGLSEFISRTGEPCTITIADEPRLLVQRHQTGCKKHCGPVTGR